MTTRAERGVGPVLAPDARHERKERSRRRILDAAREIFFRDGFMAANLDEVAQRAGVAKGTLYRYFDSKAELYVAVLAENGEAFERLLRETLSSDLSPADQIRRTGRFYFEHWSRNRDYFQIFWAIENQSVIGELPPEVVREVTRLWESCLGILAGVIEEGVRRGAFRDCDPWEMAHLLWTTANGLLQTERSAARRRLRRRPLDRAFDDAVEVILRGLA